MGGKAGAADMAADSTRGHDTRAVHTVRGGNEWEINAHATPCGREKEACAAREEMDERARAAGAGAAGGAPAAAAALNRREGGRLLLNQL